MLKAASYKRSYNVLINNGLQCTEKSDKKRDAEIDYKTMKYGQNDELRTRRCGDNWQRGIHRCRSSGGYWSEPAKNTDEQRRAKQGDKFTRNVGQQGYRTKLSTAIFSNKNT